MAALPDTGAATGLQLIGSLGLFLTTGGLGLLGATRRRHTGQEDTQESDDPQEGEIPAEPDVTAPRNLRLAGGLGLALFGCLMVAKAARSDKA